MIIDLENLDSQTNDKFLSHYETEKRYLLLYGGAGSGKSVFAVQKILFRIIAEKNHKVLVIRKVARTNRYSTFALIVNIIHQWGLGDIAVIRTGDLHISFPLFNSEILFMGADDIDKLKSIAGITMQWEEEATELTLKDHEEIDRRLRGITENYKQNIMTFNPDEAKGRWIKEMFFDKEKENACVVHSTVDDNKFIDTEYIGILDNISDPVYRDIYRKGLWAISKGLIYGSFIKIAFKDIPIHVEEAFYGVDFGFNNPSTIIKVEIKDKLIYISELLYETHLTNGDLIERMKELIPDKRCTIYCDSAEPDRIEEICRAGFNAVLSDKSVNDGIDFVKSVMKHIRVLDTSDNIIDESKVYKWKENKNGKLDDKPVKFMDHTMDGIRYALYTRFKGVWGKANVKIKTKIKRRFAP